MLPGVKALGLVVSDTLARAPTAPPPPRPHRRHPPFLPRIAVLDLLQRIREVRARLMLQQGRVSQDSTKTAQDAPVKPNT